jgi:hypothetical protein
MPRGPASSLEQRFLTRTVMGPLANKRPELGRCLLWTGRVSPDGYPRIDRGDTTITGAHAAWEIALGEELAKNFVLRHFACTRRLCVRAEHLKPWSAAEDLDHDRYLVAWNARHDQCINGHAFTHENTIEVPGGRSCRTCRRDVERERRRRH